MLESWCEALRRKSRILLRGRQGDVHFGRSHREGASSVEIRPDKLLRRTRRMLVRRLRNFFPEGSECIHREAPRVTLIRDEPLQNAEGCDVPILGLIFQRE